jgi:hypothetical protein
VDPAELLEKLARALEALRLRYLVTGSMATIFYGEPRFTNDIDVVVELADQDVRGLLAAFPSPDFYVDEESARRAVARHGQFNVIHPRSALKIDVMVASLDAFDRSRFARVRRVRTAPQLEVAFASPEDVILKKLEYHHAGGSAKHLRDIAGVLRVSGHEIDRAYIATWAERLGVAELWREVERAVPAA